MSFFNQFTQTIMKETPIADAYLFCCHLFCISCYLFHLFLTVGTNKCQSDNNLFMKPRLHFYTRLYLPFILQLLMTLKTRGQLLLPTDTPPISPVATSARTEISTIRTSGEIFELSSKQDRVNTRLTGVRSSAPPPRKKKHFGSI